MQIGPRPHRPTTASGNAAPADRRAEPQRAAGAWPSAWARPAIGSSPATMPATRPPKCCAPPVDLVLAELRMSPVSGVELTRRIRDDTALRRHAGHPDHRTQRQQRRGRRLRGRRRRCGRQAVPFRSACSRASSGGSPAPGPSRNCAPTMPRSMRGSSPGRSNWARCAQRWQESEAERLPAAAAGQPRAVAEILLAPRARCRRAPARCARLAMTKPALSPQSWRTASTLSAWNGCVPISLAIASVSWISPPAPRSPLLEHPHHLGLEDVAADHAEPRRRVGRLGLLDQAQHLGQRRRRSARA